MSPDEIEGLLTKAKTLKLRAMLSLAYGCGLRISEVVRLKVGDIDSAQNIIRIVQCKGRKDRNGALAGSVGALATPLVGKVFPNPKNDAGDFIGGTAATAVVGGVASVAGGGKFGNGAVTAGFGYMFNAALGGAIGRTGGRAAGAAACAELGPLAIVCGAAGGRIGAAIGSDIEDWLRGGTIVWNENTASSVPPLPDGLVGQNPDQQGRRVNTDLPATDFPGVVQDLTGGNVSPDDKGHMCCSNGVRIRPGEGSGGPRIDIPANGTKSHETIHFPEGTDWQW